MSANSSQLLNSSSMEPVFILIADEIFPRNHPRESPENDRSTGSRDRSEPAAPCEPGSTGWRSKRWRPLWPPFLVDSLINNNINNHNNNNGNRLRIGLGDSILPRRDLPRRRIVPAGFGRWVSSIRAGTGTESGPGTARRGSAGRTCRPSRRPESATPSSVGAN